MRARWILATVVFTVASPVATLHAAQPQDANTPALSADVVPAPMPAPLPPPAAPDVENAPADDTPIPVPPVPPRIAEGDTYDKCMDMLADDPAGADALATAWRGGGEAATHCHALAQIELGNPASGAAILVSLAQTSHAPASAKAEVFGQAAQAWTMAGDAPRAMDAATQAIALDPEDPDLRVTHAIAALAVHQDAAAEEDLSDAIDADPKRADALILRATARRHLGRLADAQADVEKALSLDGDNPDALLERGIIRQRQGDLAGARTDWERAETLSPDSATGDLAEQNLALLDAGPRQ